MGNYTVKEQWKIGMKESEYVKTLSSDEKKLFKSLPRPQRDDLVWTYINEGTAELPTIDDAVTQDDLKHSNWLSKQGINNPTKVTMNAIHPLVSDSKLNSFTNNWAAFTTLSIDKQAVMKSNIVQQKQNYTLIAQQDEIIKQNNEIIDLLKTIAQNSQEGN
ncbi:hypothetical protein ERX37_08020 [Macrococcus hajekii]|uniref:Uncharacterized protein n=1 Tax=Macrococcus hajekii TaxID=198482 RepID=A0A4R6BIM8_9STAP|nr:hypothetical protein [Macrococcus hajekii]TDM01438.1 hypothetical protein ERX37_08020 [Macrococcus hajekii]GGA99996.1 hypothetical protein GCM10007190_05040 [Macrococcus hajekii]